MEKVNARRGFLKGFGLGAAVIGGFASASAANAVSVVGSSVPADSNQLERVNGNAVEDISHLAPRDDISALQLQGDNRPPPPPQPVQSWSAFNVPNNLSTYTISSSSISPPILSFGSSLCPSDELNKVSMAVGKDNRLWIKVGDTWKRVVVEG